MKKKANDSLILYLQSQVLAKMMQQEQLDNEMTALMLRIKELQNAQ